MPIIKPSTAFKQSADWVSAEVRAYMKDQVSTHVDTVQDVRDNDFEKSRFIFVKSLAATFRLDLSSGTDDDGVNVLHDNIGRRYLKVIGTGLGGVDFDAQVADLAGRASYDDEAEGFKVLVSDVGDGRAAIYSKDSGASADWSDPAYVTGPRGPTGDIGGVAFQFNDGTADANPGAGNIRANNADLSAATTLFVSKANRYANSVAAYLASLDDSTSSHKGYLTLTAPDSETQATFSITGLTDASGYVKLTVSGHSGATSFVDAERLAFQFSRTGNAGDLNGVTPGSTGLELLEAETEGDARDAIEISADNTPYVPMPGYVRNVGDWMRSFRLLTDWAPSVAPSDWSSVWQEALDDMAAIGVGGTLLIPHGRFDIDTGGVLELNGVTTHASTNVVNILGCGTGQTVMGVGSGAAGLHLIGDETSGIRAYVRFQGVNFTAKTANSGIGLKARRGNYAQFIDLKFVNLDIGADTEDFLNARFQHCQFEYGNYGAKLRPKTGAGGVNTTTFTFDDCTFHSANEWGLDSDQGGMIRVRGGNFDGNGRFGVGATRGGIRMQRPGRASAKGLVAESIYFESNMPYDIRIEQGDYDCTHSVRDCDFHRNNDTYYATNNIFAGRYSGGTGYGELILDGNSHVSYETYVPSTSRKYVNLQDSNFVVRDIGTNYYQSADEAPTTFGIGGVFARCMFSGSSGSPSPYRKSNVASVSKNSTGNWTVTLVRPIPGLDTSTVVCSVRVYGAAGVGWGEAVDTQTITVRTYDLTGSPTDFSRINLEVFG